MTSAITLEDPQAGSAPDAQESGPEVAARLAQLEGFAAQVSGAIDQLVGAVVEVQQAQGASGLQAELDATKAKLRDLEQQLALDRSTRDLAQVSRMHPKARRVVFLGTTYFGCNVKYAWSAAHQQAAARGLEVWFLPYNAEQERLVTALGGRCLPVGHANWSADHLHTALSAAVEALGYGNRVLNQGPITVAFLLEAVSSFAGGHVK